MKTSGRRRGVMAAVSAALILLASCAQVDSPPATPGGAGDQDPPATATDTPGGEATEDQTASDQLVAGCEAPPALPEAPPTFDQSDAPSDDPAATLYATVTTNCGELVIELDGASAPVTVASFAQLAEHGYWADSPCHRLTTSGIFVLQCGDPTGTGRGGPGYTFGIENAPADGSYPRGSIAMARTQDPNSNGGQYFIVYEDTELPVQGGGYSIFGSVVSGMDIIDQIAEQGTREGSPDGSPAQGISVLSVEISEEKATQSD